MKGDQYAEKFDLMTETLTRNEVVDVEEEFIFHLANKDSLEFILREGLSTEVLIRPQTKSIFQFVQHHFNQTGKVPSVKVLRTEFSNTEFKEPETTIEWIVERLSTRYQRNQINDMLLDVGVSVADDPKEAMSKLRNKVFEIERNSLSQRHVWKPGDHKIFLYNLQQKILAGGYNGASIGFKDIDQHTGGIKNGNLAYILARPKRQKTFFILNAFVEQARAGMKPILFTLENTEEEIMLRISCMLTGIPWDKAQKGQLLSKDYKTMDAAWEAFNQYEHYIEMPPLDERTVSHLLMKADKIEAEAILISQFRYVKGTRDWYRTDMEENADVAVDLKRAATRPGSERPILVEAQFNRGGDSMEELEDFDPSKVGLTDMITQSADTLYGLFQSKDLATSNIIEFGILEARNHGKGAWHVESHLVSKTGFRLIPGSYH